MELPPNLRVLYLRTRAHSFTILNTPRLIKKFANTIYTNYFNPPSGCSAPLYLSDGDDSEGKATLNIPDEPPVQIKPKPMRI